ncbi:MMPL family transporter [Bacillaceae bacterium W0354]
MRKSLQAVTDLVTTKRGVWITLSVWLIVTMALAFFAPSAKDYEVTSIDSLPDDARSVIAQEKVDEYFKEQEGIPAILVFQSTNGELSYDSLANVMDEIMKANVTGVEQVVPVSQIPPQAAMSFFSEDLTTAAIPIIFNQSLENKDLKSSKEKIMELVEGHSNIQLFMTGPAGIATDTLDLFSRADLVLIFSTIGLILVLLIVIYRSPLLALIPLLGAAFVYEVVMQTLGIFGSLGLMMSNQTLSIMSILLFAAVIDYSLFVFSRFREELKNHQDKYEAMKLAMRGTGLPVFFSGGTVLAAMLVLFFAQFGDYRNFAPTFATTMAVIMVASITLVPALFTLFGRKSFWPKIPRVGDETVKSHSLWSRVGRFVVKKPGLSVGMVGLFILISASNLFNIQYDFNMLNSFPDDMPSREGYHILEEKFDKGDLAPTTVLLEADHQITEEQQEALRKELEGENLVANVRLSETAADGRVIEYSLTFSDNPYSVEAIDALETMISKSDEFLSQTGLSGELYFSGETAKQVDDRAINNRDVLLIVILETLLIFALLIVMTKSVKMPIYMMGTILVSFLAALGLGMFLTDLFFGIETISNRVPLYSFVFLVALGIDYNIMLVSRYQEEREKHSVKKSVELAVANTGGVISSAGLILAATFAVLMTQPIQLLFVFGFIVAVGILIDTFIVRGVLMPGLIVLLEKDNAK